MKTMILFLILPLVFTACGSRSDVDKTSESATSAVQKQKKLEMVYVYTGPEFNRLPLLAELTAEYGLAESGGSLVLVNSVTELENIPVASILLLVGADSRIVRPLSYFSANRLDVRIITLFPLVDAMEVECFSELVLDVSTSRDLLEAEASVGGSLVKDTDLAVLFLAAVRFAKHRNWNLNRIEQLNRELVISSQNAGRLALPTGWNITRFIDPETGIRSRNHLVLTVAEEK